ncbi:MAG: methylenetetrahydrofolate reductase [Candidatus Thorarchaeota archaeon]|nr:methylenetetrahydrofolate reductase [Candidatus Thorarchaeota archaeon]
MTKSRLERLLNSEEFVVTCEVAPPHGADHTLIEERTRLVKDYCDAINITDNVRGIPTMDSGVCAHFVLKAGAEPIMQMSARDRNRVLYESQLYGAYALGIRNVVFITGDHSLLGTHPQAKTVFDLDSVQAIQLAKCLMGGTDLSGAQLEGTPEFFLGATFNPFADPQDLQVWRVEKKRDAGAQFFQTQAIYDLDRFESFLSKVRPLKVKVLAGVIPLKSTAMAKFMRARIPGMRIPDKILARLENAGAGLKGVKQKNAIRSEGLLVAEETINTIHEIAGVHGVHIMSVGWEENIPSLVKSCNLYPRPA